jgi:hypothetical protein
VDLNPTDLNGALRAAVADAPPTTIDLDRLIGGERRRQRSMRTLALVCGAATSVLMVVMVVFWPWSRTPPTRQVTAASSSAASSSGSPRPCPSLAQTGPPRPYQSGNASPRPVPEPCGDAAFRLNGALARALRTHAPGVTFADVTGSGQPVRFLRANDENLRYDTGLSLSTAAGRGGASVGVEPQTYAPPSEADLRHGFGCDRSPSLSATCVYRSFPDGTIVSGVLLSSKTGAIGPAGTRQHQLRVFRPDDTVVTLIVNNTYYDGVPDPNATPKLGGTETPLTLEQLVAIGRDPGLTLYP